MDTSHRFESAHAQGGKRKGQEAAGEKEEIGHRSTS
jgi:hypothetical protein